MSFQENHQNDTGGSKETPTESREDTIKVAQILHGDNWKSVENILESMSIDESDKKIGENLFAGDIHASDEDTKKFTAARERYNHADPDESFASIPESHETAIITLAQLLYHVGWKFTEAALKWATGQTKYKGFPIERLSKGGSMLASGYPKGPQGDFDNSPLHDQEYKAFLKCCLSEGRYIDEADLELTSKIVTDWAAKEMQCEPTIVDFINCVKKDETK
ncbi:hypothetical protein SBOR_6398 [Sclerotinia borealis F-4128]|uniref:Uncharacterized protein n=1 Tax=Sclerotinia borealis (strain F-4128) TaxID=1432307 RepID=W9C8W6_SCLBF|nr:hypothetical protein SBOR_6398 [Sclerotinia borealis F-4128]